MATRKTLKDFLGDTNFPKSQEVLNDGDDLLRYKLGFDGLPTRFAREEEDDLNEGIKETLSSYIKYIVDEASNIYGPANTDYTSATQPLGVSLSMRHT